MARRNIFFVPLTLLVLSLSTLVNGQFWYIDDLISFKSGTHPYLRTCLFVITKAFHGYGTVNLGIGSGQYLRWGQQRCVVEIGNFNSFSISITGDRLADALVQNMVAHAYADPNYFYGGRSRYSAFSAGTGTYLYMAHADAFGGDVGYPQKRDVNDTMHAHMGESQTMTPVDPATNDFAAHLLTLNFEDDEERSTTSSTTDPEPRADVLPRGAPPQSHSDAMFKSTDAAKRAAGDGEPYSCTTNIDGKADIVLSCACRDQYSGISGLDGQYAVTCVNDRSLLSAWTISRISAAARAIRTQVQNLNAQGWGGTQTVLGTSSTGGILFTQPNANDRPRSEAATCCERMIARAANQMGFAPSTCTCDMVSRPAEQWHMMMWDRIMVGA